MSNSGPSLTWRAALAFAVTCAAVLGLAALALYRSLEAEIAWRDDVALMGRLEQVRALLQDSDSLGALQQRPRLYQNMLGNQDSLLLVGRERSADVISINPHGDALPSLPPLPVGVPPGRSDVVLWAPDHGPALLLLAGAAQGPQGEALQVTVGKRLDERTAMLARYRLRVYLTVAGGSVLALLLGFVLLRRALRPLGKMADDVARIDLRSLDRRLHLERLPQELHLPVHALNGMLERLEDSFARLAQFSADLAHEMRTPLHTLLASNGQALSQARTVTDYQDLLASNVEEFERLNRMVANLLFLARADHGDCPLTRGPIDLATLGTELCDYFEALAEDRGLTLRNGLSGTLRADLPLLQRALANLLANAVRHATEGTRIDLRSRATPDALVLEVANQGLSIAPEHLPRLFERFYRVAEHRTDPGDSGGLGLALVQSIMGLHAGTVQVTSKHGETVFSLVFAALEQATSNA
jgi:two-component system heavy metal sensor histidine kinase CusS